MGFGCQVYIFSCDINRLIFSKCDKWPLQWSASSFEPSEEEEKKKANLVLQFQKTLDEDFFFPLLLSLLINSVLLLTVYSSCWILTTASKKLSRRPRTELISIALHKNGWVHCHVNTALSGTCRLIYCSHTVHKITEMVLLKIPVNTIFKRL